MSPGEARQQLEVAALGRDLGDLFEYHVKGPVTIHKNQSALVPIIQANVEAEKVSLWNPALESARPLRFVAHKFEPADTRWRQLQRS
jgi:hypothetical protein